VVALAAAVGRVRPVRPEVVEDTPYRWARSFACDRASPLGIAAERVLAGSA
jgi:hypothetical protein